MKNRNEYVESKKDPLLQEDLDRLTERLAKFEELNGASVLITGATGLVGSVIVKSLACLNRKKGWKITILPFVRNKEKAERIFGNILDRDNVRLVNGDVLNPIEIEESIDYIIHCASVTASKVFVTKPVETLNTSIQGTQNALNLAHRNQIKSMVYVSSMEAFGITDPQNSDVKEENLGYIDLMNVRSCYSEGKRVCELLCACYAQEYQVPVRIVRLAQTFGAGVLPTENRVFAQFAKSAIHGTDIVLHTKGESWGNYCYTADAVAAIFTVLVKGKTANIYTAANPTASIKIKDMAKMVADEIADGKIHVIYDIPEDAFKYGYAPDVVMHLNSDKLQSLGWVPEYDLSEMYKRLVASFEAQGIH